MIKPNFKIGDFVRIRKEPFKAKVVNVIEDMGTWWYEVECVDSGMMPNLMHREVCEKDLRLYEKF